MHEVKPPPGSHAILIGVAAYESAELPPVAAALNSLEAMRAMLTDPDLCGWTPDQVTVIADPRRVDDLAVRIADLAEGTTGALLVYFVGHGILSNRGELCLTVATTRPDRARYTGLAWNELAEALRSSPAMTRIAILDCCFAGKAIEALAAEGDAALADLSHVHGVYTLTATTRNRTAHVPPPDRQATACTSFTGELQAMLNAGVEGAPNVLTFQHIYPNLRQRLRAKGLPEPSQRGTDGAGSFPFARNRKGGMPDDGSESDTGEIVSVPRVRTPAPALARRPRRASPVTNPLGGDPAVGRAFLRVRLAAAAYVAQASVLWAAGSESHLLVRVMALIGLCCVLALAVRHPIARLACMVREAINLPFSLLIYVGFTKEWGRFGDAHFSNEIGFLAAGSALASVAILALLLPRTNRSWFLPDQRSAIPMPVATPLFFVLLSAQMVLWFISPHDGGDLLLAMASLWCGLLFWRPKTYARWILTLVEILITAYAILMPIVNWDASPLGHRPYSEVAAAVMQVGLGVAIIVSVFWWPRRLRSVQSLYQVRQRNSVRSLLNNW